ncbi:MAG TPA: DUF190 domain-containing protein [Candidatus Omnitrophota bacterium]|nr:DUF190 domain-containing protein [Candidatus Omnitrophota bacterium]
MQIPSEGKLLRIFVGEADKYKGQPLYQAIVRLAKEKGMAGATVIRGIMGFGCKSHMHMAKLLDISTDLPMIVEIVDGEQKINDFIPYVNEMVKEGLVTLEKANVIMYRAG